jgi:hypothetical protein
MFYRTTVKKYMKKTANLILIILITANCVTYGQLAVGYNTDGNTLSLSINPAGKFWGELRINTKAYNQASWSYSDRGIPQVYFIANIFTSQNVTLYAGAGAGMNILSKDNEKWTSVNIPVGLKTNPFSKLSHLYLFAEYNPMLITKDELPVIHTVSLGFRFIFSKKE